MGDPQSPPYSPGVRKHLPDVRDLYPAEGLLTGIMEDNGHLLDPGAQAVGQGQKLYVESISFDLPDLDELTDKVTFEDLDAGLRIVAGKAEQDLEPNEVSERYKSSQSPALPYRYRHQITAAKLGKNSGKTSGTTNKNIQKIKNHIKLGAFRSFSYLCSRKI